MNIQDWIIYNKTGSRLNLTANPLASLIFNSTLGVDAEGFLITDPSENLVSVKITNGGHFYSESDTVSFSYIFNDAYVPLVINTDVSIIYTDVSVFNPDPTNVKTISDVSILSTQTVDVSNFVYPLVTYAGAIFLDPVSVKLVETEHLFIFEQTAPDTYIRPYDASNSILIFKFLGEENQIRFFQVDENTQEISWADELQFNTSVLAENTPLTLNIGFRAEQEGVYERLMGIYHFIGTEMRVIAEIMVNAEAIGEDERFRDLLSNFGLPDPKDFPDIFKETDINEDLPDWEILNPKSKHMILEHDKIMPYVGTYKALINALKWLGYDDIYVREWFLNVKENRKLSFIVPFEAKDRSQTILMFSPDERKIYKKLNQLSLHYCITRETGEIDDWGTPLTENCYTYNLKEIYIKLLGLKQWLEQNIIGVNCRITDVTGEGIYFERFINLIYATGNVGYNLNTYQSLTPETIEESSELIQGDASICLTLKEITATTIGDLPYRFIDLVDYAWNPNDPSAYIVDASGAPHYVTVTTDDPSYLADPSSYLLVGGLFNFPFKDLKDIQWKLSVEKNDAGVIGVEQVTNPLFILENDIRFYDIFDTSTIFHNASTNLNVLLEYAYFRDPSNDVWTDSIAYTLSPDYYIRMLAGATKTLTYDASYAVISGDGSIYIDSSIISFNSGVNPIYFNIDSSAYIIAQSNTVIEISNSNGYVLESSLGVQTFFDNYMHLIPTDDTSAILQYAFDDNYKVPLLSINQYFAAIDENANSFSFTKTYYLDIVDGKIIMDNGENSQYNINFNYDTSIEEQMITLNVLYYSDRLPLFVVDPSVYYWGDPSGLSGGNDPSILAIDNSIYCMTVNHIGDYNIEVFGWDGYNTPYYNEKDGSYNVWIKYPTIYTLIDSCCNANTPCVSTWMPFAEVSTLVNSNAYPIYDKLIPLQGLSLEIDVDGNPYLKVPSITFFQDVPEPNSINRFFNMTERVTGFASFGGGALYVDTDFQAFRNGDNIRVVKFDNGKYSFISEVSSFITGTSFPPFSINLDVSLPLDYYQLNSSTSLYVLNDTYRPTDNAANVGTNLVIDVCANMTGTDPYVFQNGQLVSIVVTNASNGYAWGASYRVIDSCNGTHTLNNTLPQFFVNDPSKYIIEIKHAFSSYSDFTINTESATEVNNNFEIYLQESYCQEYYLDNTFVLVNILFDQDTVNEQWYNDSSDNLLNSSVFYYHTQPIVVDASTLVILKAQYDPSSYLLNQKNIWTVSNNLTGDIVFKVFNYSVAYIFDVSGYYDVQVESYDSYGNIITKTYDGLIKIV